MQSAATPEPKRQRVAAREEDPDDLTEPPLQQDPDLQDVLTQHWSSIRSHVARGTCTIQTRYNYRLENNNTRALDLRQIFREQTTASERSIYHTALSPTTRFLVVLSTIIRLLTAAVDTLINQAWRRMWRRSKRFPNASTNKISCNGQSLNDLIPFKCNKRYVCRQQNSTTSHGLCWRQPTYLRET